MTNVRTGTGTQRCEIKYTQGNTDTAKDRHPGKYRHRGRQTPRGIQTQLKTNTQGITDTAKDRHPCSEIQTQGMTDTQGNTDTAKDGHPREYRHSERHRPTHSE